MEEIGDPENIFTKALTGFSLNGRLGFERHLCEIVNSKATYLQPTTIKWKKTHMNSKDDLVEQGGYAWIILKNFNNQHPNT